MNKIAMLTFLIFSATAFAQRSIDNYMILNYDEVIQLSHEQSPAALSRKTEKKNSYWEYKSFKSNYLPQLVLNADVPGFLKQYTPYIDKEGNVEYTLVHRSISGAALKAEQLIGFTGGNIYVNTDLDPIYDFKNDSLSYRYSPIAIGLVQPILKFNPHRWDKKIEELRFLESEKKYCINMEEISITATRLYFNLMIAQIEHDIAEINLKNNDTIYKIAIGRYDLGKIAENEYLQIELQYLRSQQQLEKAKIDIQNSQLWLKNYLGIKDSRNVQLVLPEHLYDFDVDLNVALEQARINRPEILQYEREKLQAERELKKAKANSGLNADLVVEYGLESQPEELYEAFDNVGSKQQLNVRMSIPILDWGRAKSQKNKALANLELVEYNKEQDLINFEQEIITHVNSFLQSKNQVELAKRADEIGRKRYEVAKNRYMIGNISITDINIASQEKDAAKKSYVQALNNYWMAYYKLRKLTLYDFRFNQLIYKL